MCRSSSIAAPSRSGDGTGDGRGDGSGEGEVDVRGDGFGDRTGDGMGKGSPTRRPFLGTSGLRRERAVEGMACGARGRACCRFFTWSRLGNTPSGAPLLGLAPSCTARRAVRDRPAPATQIGESETASREEQSANEINRIDILEAERFEDIM